MTASIPTEIEAGQAPGGLVFVHYVDGSPELVQPLPAGALDSPARDAGAAYAAQQTNRWATAGREVVMVVYSGDSGAALINFPVSLFRILRDLLDL